MLSAAGFVRYGRAAGTANPKIHARCLEQMQRGGRPFIDTTRRANQLPAMPHLKSSPSRKNFSLSPSGKSPVRLRASHPKEGRLAIVTNARWDAVDARPAKDERWLFADGEVVWSWRRGAGAKLCGSFREATVARKPFTEESTK